MLKKSVFFALALSVFASVGFAQQGDNVSQVSENSEKPAVLENEEKISKEMTILQTAYNLAEFGYEKKSASALIEAAELIISVDLNKIEQAKTEPTKESVKTTTLAKKEGGNTKSEKSSGHDYSALQLVEDGIKMAGKDKNLVAWGKSVKKEVEKAEKGTRGASRGPQYDIDVASGHGGSVNYTIWFDGGRYASVNVTSLDGCDYDLFIYDENGNLVDSDPSYRCSAFCSFCPRWTGPFRIVVKNRSNWAGAYRMTTN